MKGATLFKKWFGASKVRETATAPLVVYHGTTHDFPSFTVERANPENYWGSGFYFTTSAEDAGDNYAGEGPDLTQRIDTMAEKIADRLEDAAEDAITVAQRRQFFEKGREEARKILKGSHGGAILPVYLKIVKPLVLGAPYGLNSVGSLKETVWSPEKAAEFGQYVLEEAGAFDDAKDFFASDFEEFIADSERRAEDVIETLKNDESITYATDENGLLMTSEILGRAIRRMGYDGIIDRAVAKRFPNMMLSYNDAHFIVWTPEQIKSVFNRGTWNPKDPVISNGDKARVARCGGRTVRYGAKGAKVMPGTPKGDAYCARSLGQMRDHPEAAKDPCSPLRLSRKRWACEGAKSVKTNPIEDEGNVALPADIITLAPNPTPFGDVVFEPDVKENGITREGIVPLADIIRELEGVSIEAGSEGLARLIARLRAFKPKGITPTWKRARDKMIRWLEAGMPMPSSDRLGTANEIVVNLRGSRAVCFSIFAQGNSKLPYLAFSTLPGVTCPGAGECLVAAGRKHDPRRRLNGGWCYSFKAWRYPDAFFRQLGNTILIRSEKGRAHIAKVFSLWAETRARIAGGETVRLYVDGDMDSVETLKFWMDRCKAHPHVRAYGYSKSWHLFLRYDKLGYGWPSNYVMNLSEGSRFATIAGIREEMLKLPVVREDFGVVVMPEKVVQNIVRIGRGEPNGVWAAISRLEERASRTADESEKSKLQLIVADWKAIALKIKKGEKVSYVPDEFWSRNPEYTATVSAEAEKKYGKGNFFVCPGKCGNCLGNGRHACGDLRLKKPIVIGIH
jgi:hypothetical protein